MKRQCAILRLDAIGDFVLWLDAAEALIAYELKIGAEITVFCKECNKFIAKRFLDNRVKIMSLNEDVGRAIEQIQNNGVYYDVLYQCAYNNTPYIDTISKNILAVQKISINGSEKIYTRCICPQNKWQHEYIKNIDFVREITNADVVPSVHFRKQIREDYFCVLPYASMAQKSLNILKYKEIIKYILDVTEVKCVLLGQEKEKDSIDFLAQSISPDRCISLAGETSIEQYWKIIEKARFVIGNDSSCIHIAAYCGVPSICIAGGQHWKKFIPYDESMVAFFEKPIVVEHHLSCFQCNFERRKRTIICNMSKIRKKKFPCIENVSVEDVIEKVEKVLYKDKLQNDY